MAEKIGAGFLFICNDDHIPKILLLKRSPNSGNPNTMGLPGGNKDPGDGDLLMTAQRETIEEMGTLPSKFTILGEFLTHRGKRLQKHYTVYLAEISLSVRQQWQPKLNKEHSGFEWISLENAMKRNDLHPVVQRVLLEEPHKTRLLAMVSQNTLEHQSNQ